METNDLDWTKQHPVSFVQWVPAELVYANDYNPNAVARPEMELLELSILEDGFTQPIVVWQTEQGYEVVDGFHRNLVGKKLGLSHLPVVVVNVGRTDKGDRIASTIRHNRARGKHQVGAMSEIVQELARRNWNDQKIAKELGMEPDEVLRLKQISGLAEMFADDEFSEAWEIE
jgi:ParB-like chromosome segregation protein Spo0J